MKSRARRAIVGRMSARWFLIPGLLLLAAPAAAQVGVEASAEVEAQGGVEASAEVGADAAVEASAETSAETTSAQGAAPPPGRAQRRPPPPIMVLVVPARRVPDAISASASAALVTQLEAMSGGRPVLAVGAQAQAMIDAIAACEDDACVGALLAEAGAQAGAVLRLSRSRRGVSASLELRDPVSGTLRHEPIEGELPRTEDGVAEALASLSAQLEGSMPSPPPPPATLLVTVNVDGAAIELDGTEIGESPVAAVEVADGDHTIVVRADGYNIERRSTRVAPGARARVDVTLTEVGAVSQLTGEAPDPDNPWAQPSEGEGELTEQWWFWTAIGGGAALLLGVVIIIGVAASDQGPPPEPPDPTGIMLPPIMGGF